MLKRLLLSAAVLSGAASATDAQPVHAAPPERGEPHFVAMDEIIVPIVESDHIEGSLRFDIVLDAADEAAEARLTAAMPDIRATSVAAALEFARLYASGQNAVNAQQLASDLTHALQTRDAGVARVLIVKISAASA
jgi:flagellar basal body-associated protein FliL